jgi:hypothetical protein
MQRTPVLQPAALCVIVICMARPKKMRITNRGSRRGIVILMVLVAIVIMMMLYFIDIKAIFGPNLKDKSGQPTLRPWLQEDRLAGPDELIKMPKPPRPTIDEDFAITGFVTSDGAGRGKVILEFNTAGEVAGRWNCEYSNNDRDYTFTADFAGNIDVTKTFSDDHGQDKSLLYFIAKGRYTHETFSTQVGLATKKTGIIYATGYLAGDYTASGQMVITDKQHSFSASFNWQSE